MRQHKRGRGRKKQVRVPQGRGKELGGHGRSRSKLTLTNVSLAVTILMPVKKIIGWAVMAAPDGFIRVVPRLLYVTAIGTVVITSY